MQAIIFSYLNAGKSNQMFDIKKKQIIVLGHKCFIRGINQNKVILH